MWSYRIQDTCHCNTAGRRVSACASCGTFPSRVDAGQVSVRLGGLADRERKAEACCWSMHTRLSVEDPFETW